MMLAAWGPQPATAEVVRYDGHQVVEAYPRSSDELDAWLELTDDVWSEHLSSSIVLRIAPEHLPALRHSNLVYRVLYDDLQVALDAESQRVALAKQQRQQADYGGPQITDYLDLGEYRAVVDGWVAAYPEITEIETFGESVEGRPIRALHVSGEGGDDKPVLMLLSGHHAREWLAHHATLCAMGRLLDGYGSDDEATYWLDRVEFVYIPMGNPDGYDYTWTVDRLWRKNRGAGGQGVDLNRNWDAAWGTASSGIPSSQVYHGTGPFSEPETLAFSELIAAHADRIQGFVDVHAFGSIILYPYGYTTQAVDNEAEYTAVAAAMAAATNDAYLPVKISDFVGGAASGSSVDWVHDNVDGGLGLGIEVRGISFTEPASQILPTCDELYPSFIALLESFEVMDPEPPEGSTGEPLDGSGTSDGDPDTGAIDSTAGTSSAGSGTGATPPEPPSTTEDTGLPMGTGQPSQDDGPAGQGCACGVARDRGSSWVPWGWMLLLTGVGARRRRR
ncbi:MAG: M14 family zinc carboxypeptidase [Myxococcota bacterium]